MTLSGFSPGELEVGDTFEIMSVAGDIGGVDASDPLRPRPDLSLFPVFQEVDILPGLTSFGLPADAVMIPIFTENSILLGIRSILGLIGADFNGDGVVDLADLAILEANIGITMGATPLQGDADRDGDVDGDDFLLWQRTIGPVPAGGFGSHAALANVPEPAGVALFVSGMLALAATLAAPALRVSLARKSNRPQVDWQTLTMRKAVRAPAPGGRAIVSSCIPPAWRQSCDSLHRSLSCCQFARC